MRPLGIPCAIDKIIQECIKIIIEPICEAKFYPKSYGFKPYRSILNAGYLYMDEKYETTSGSAQGGVISALLANVYLNDLDWTIGRMYHFPKTNSKSISGARWCLRNKGVSPKYFIRFCDDWLLLTTNIKEAERLLKYLNKYFKYCLKLTLSKEKTLITDITKTRAKFLGFEVLASPKRATPEKKSTRIVGKFFPNKERCKLKMDGICKEIKKLRYKKSSKDQAIHIEKVNSMIAGLAETYKTSICTYTYRYMDRRIYIIHQERYLKLCLERNIKVK